MTSSPTAYERYRPWRRWVEVGFVGAILVSNALGNSITVWMDHNRSGATTLQPWEPWAWEISSALLWALVIPLIARFTERYPMHRDNWRRMLGVHLAASVVVSLVHVAGMVALRTLAYRWHGMDYDFGPWPRNLSYEYLKDIRSYAAIVVVIEGYRLLLRRLQGEVRLLGRPDEGAPVEPVDRPERFLVRKLGREFLLAADDIEWVQAAGNYVNLRVRGHDYPLRSTIGGIVEKLDPARFVRIHRSYIVNLDQLVSFEPLETGDARVHLKDGTTLPGSRKYRSELRGRLADA
ncbi:LytTR family transcriptional regulator [Luteimonas aestuarii]|uniref:LytTR family transcriptional regulator n=1 Tax=Luteimonas aestuarii TaxID=453837 RepID=A0A4R5TM22_9GAMM|nr:LytTR family DNA-binding domain-containing protein [Luteimonas aestuarii]TDK23408.1 LytTR family transcriptional regulator [Luteimonas aestuarii]